MPYSKTPARRRAAIAAARARWGPPRVVRLDDLTAPQRRLVMALVDAARKEAAPVVSETSTEAAAEVSGASRRRAPAA